LAYKNKGDDSLTVVALIVCHAGPDPASSGFPCRLPQQRQHALWQLVGLRHHGGVGLLQV